jgi:hypothetical protein
MFSQLKSQSKGKEKLFMASAGSIGILEILLGIFGMLLMRKML